MANWVISLLGLIRTENQEWGEARRFAGKVVRLRYADFVATDRRGAPRID